MNQNFEIPSSICGCTNRMLSASGVEPLRESVFRQIHQQFTLEESLRICYVPILLNLTAFRMAEDVCRQCAQKKLPHNKEICAIRKAAEGYLQSAIGNSVPKETIEKVYECADKVFEEAGYDLTILWYTVNQSLKTKYPNVDMDYKMLTDVFSVASMLSFTKKLCRSLGDTAKSRTGLLFGSFIPEQTEEVCKNITAIAKKGGVDIEYTSTHHLAVEIIEKKIEKIAMELHDLHKQNIEEGFL